MTHVEVMNASVTTLETITLTLGRSRTFRRNKRSGKNRRSRKLFLKYCSIVKPEGKQDVESEGLERLQTGPHLCREVSTMDREVEGRTV